MLALKQPAVGLLVRAVLVAAVSTCSVTVWAQAGGQGSNPGAAPGSAAAPAKNVAPPPADLEPGVNTSATQPSSPELAPAAAAPAPKPASIAAKRAPPSGRPTAPTAGPPANSTTESSSSAPGTTFDGGTSAAAGAPKGRATTAAAPRTGAPAGKAHDNLELDTTQITGNRELPKVLYIVPWKRSDLGDLVGKPVNSLLDEVLTPVDRDVFKRQNRYYDALKPDDAKDAAGAAPGPK